MLSHHVYSKQQYQHISEELTW